MLEQFLDFQKMKSSSDLVCLNAYLPIMDMSGQLSLISCAKIMVLYISILHSNGPYVME
jgi:hypothetical protein